MLNWQPSLAERHREVNIDRRAPAQPPRAPSGLEVLVKSQYQRVERVILFAAELAETLRKEFEAVWAAMPTGSAGELAEQLAGRLDVLDAKVARARTQLRGVNPKFPPEAMRQLQAFDLNDLTASAKGLEGLAAQLREAVAAPPAPAEAAPAEAKGIMGFLRKLAADPTVVEGTTRSAPPPRPVIDPAVEKAKQAFEGAVQLVADVMEYIGPRLTMVKVPLEVIGLPGRKKPWDDVKATLLPTGQAQGLPPASMKWLPHLAKLFYSDMNATQKAHMAVVQWGEAQTLYGDAQLLQSALASAPPERVKRLLDSFNTGKLRAAIFPLSHLHMSFRGIPHLESIFPPPTA